MRNYKTYSVEEAKSRMERYCAYRERCHKEVHQKLVEMRMIPEAVDLILHHLITQNYLNETRFSQAFVRGKFRIKKWGKHRIIRELKSRNISKYNIKLGLKEVPEEEYLTVFHELSEKRWQQLASEENLQKKKKKFTDYLIYRGWESQLIWEKLRELVS
ncbi:MAG: RecX family transcriptional regulator [Bacteroidia bacterium]|nr:RecX family transcriptional regulator [Bacteroidia bacterium]NNF30452.1 RecX family transcriptional regulator [Flavobacteriaceae bacterium]NNJ80656.1 RecX family transcriptional regulator [Flavobacteriaceae bacterium]NNM08781.1 RecX family transcriptional regulator [Flavobacteriaceae bacterium]